jgi:DNA-binding NarL/FixJ family response regulator
MRTSVRRTADRCTDTASAAGHQRLADRMGHDCINIVVCDDTEAIRALVRHGLQRDPMLRVVAEAADGEDGVEAVGREHPDIVVLDIAMPRLDGLSAIPHIRARSPATKILLYTSRAAPDRSGADGYLHKGAPLAALRAAVRELAAAA